MLRYKLAGFGNAVSSDSNDQFVGLADLCERSEADCKKRFNHTLLIVVCCAHKHFPRLSHKT